MINIINKSTLIIPDIHQHVGWADSILLRHETEVDKIIFLGDYFDDFNPPYGVLETAAWLIATKERLGEKAIFLLGNHDLPYMETRFSARKKRIHKQKTINTFCSGFTSSKSIKINKVITEEFWQSCEPFCVVNGHILSHAGIMPNFMPYAPTFQESLEKLYSNIKEALKDIHSLKSNYFEAGLSRGGDIVVGSPFWCDFNVDFADLLDYPQIFGHTREAGSIRQEGRSYCIDGGEATYCILKENEIEFNSTDFMFEFCEKGKINTYQKLTKQIN